MSVSKSLSDFNDLAAVSGIDAVRQQLSKVINNPVVVSQSAANDESQAEPIAATKAPVAGDDYKLQDMLKRYAQITEPGKVTNKVYDLQQKIEYTKTQFAHEIGNKKLAEKWWTSQHRKISKAEVAKDRDELMAVEAQDMIDRYFLIYGTKEVWDDVERTRFPADTIKLARPNEYEIWLKSPYRKTVKADNIWFDPTRLKQPKFANDLSVNTFDGLPLKPLDISAHDALGLCRPVIELLHHLCEYNQDVLEWVLRWLAIPLQSPGTKMDTALIFHGEIQGAGKSLFFDRIMSRIYGDYAVTLGQGQLESQYNDWVSNKLYALFEEIFSGSDRYSQMGMVKQLITGNTIYISKKFMNGWQQDNFVNAIFLSNNMMPLSLEQNDRRHVVCYPTKKIPEPLLNEVAQALNDPENKIIRAFYTYLLKMNTNGQTAHTEAIMTKSKRKLIRLSQPNWETFYDDWKSGEIGVPYSTCLTEDMYFVYREWCRRQGERATSQTKLMTYIGRRELKESRHYQMPGMISAKKKAMIIINQPIQYPTDGCATQQTWLGLKIQQFKQAINSEFDPPM